MPAIEILIADDHDLLRRKVRSLLESRSEWRVCGEAVNGEEAVEKAKQLRPHVVLMDLSMPKMDGSKATRIIRQKVPESKVIIVSQNDPEVVRQQARGLGAAAWVAKSKLAKDLIPTIQETISNRNHDDARETHPSPGQLFIGGGEMGERIRSFDWSETVLGPVDRWPESLKTAVRICIGSRNPIVIWWGRSTLSQFYNDAYISFLGSKKHPAFFGGSARECWSEIWETMGPMVEQVFTTGEATWSEDFLYVLNRNLPREEGYFTFSYSPIWNDAGSVEGIFCACYETTARVIGDRRLRTLRDLGRTVSAAKTAEEACKSAATILEDNPADVPFALLYLLDNDAGRARLRATSGFAGENEAAPELIDLSSATASPWPLREVLDTGETEVVSDLANRFKRLPGGAWPESPENAVVVPIPSAGQSRPAGFLVAALSPRRIVDTDYRSFFDLIVGHVSTAIANARAYEHERKRAEALAEIDSAKTRFFNNVSHEFRTPLTLMLGPLEEALFEGQNLTASQRERLEVAHRNSLRLLKLVNTLLDFSRIEAGRIQACYESTDLAKVTSELASVFRSAIERAGVQLLVNCEDVGEDVYIDREMWEKIVFNLLSNALKFTFAGEIEISLRRANNSAELAVRDTGTGIPSQDLPHLFERFHRVKGAQGRTFEGSGIGLALVQELAKLHGGTVRVESKEGDGSRFTVSVPLGRDHLPADRIGGHRNSISTVAAGEVYLQEALRWLPNNSESSRDLPVLPSLVTSDIAAESRSEHARRILLADDNADMRSYLQRLLQGQYQVVAVADGQSALENARQDPPDLVVADVMMPGQDGFGLLRELRADERLNGIPVLLLSARAGEESRIEGLRVGADDYLVKPFSARELLARVGSHLAMARLRREAADTERKLRAEAETERSRLRHLFMQAPAAIGLLSGPEHRFTFVNRAYVRLTGRLRTEDFVGRTVREVFPEIEGQGILELLDDAFETGVPYIGAARKMILNRGPNGQPEETYFDFVYQPIRDSAGRVESILVHGVDVTQQVSARREIERRERQFREMIDALPAAIYTTDAQGRLTHFNPAAVAFSGRTPEIGTDQWCVCWKLYYPDGRPMPHDECPMAIALKQGRVIKGAEAVAERPDGTLRWFTPYPAPLRDNRGNIAGGINMLLDITDRKRAEEASGHLAAIVASSDDAIISKNLDGIVRSWNKSAERLFGYSAEEAVGRHITLIIPPDRRKEEEDILRRLRRGERVDHFETVRRRKDGTFIDVSLTISPVHDASGKVIGASKVARDITESKLAQEALRESKRRLTAEAEALVKLNKRSGRLWRSRSLQEGLDEMLGAAVKLLDAQKGNVQILGHDRRLRIAAERGFDKEFLDLFREVAASDESACGRALRTGERVIVEDVEADESFAPLRPIARRSGFQAVVSTPLIGADGIPLGVLSVHFGAVHRPNKEDLQRLDLYVRQATDFIQRCRMEEALRHSEEQFRKLSETLDAEVRVRTEELEERNTEVLRQSNRVRALSWRLLRAQDEERRHIARELHDSAGQTLTVLGMYLAQLVEKTGRNAPGLANDAEVIQEMVQQLHQEIRTTSYLLHPPLLDEVGLYSALSWYTQGLTERSGLEIKLDISPEFGRLPRDMELVVFRSVQECLANIHRHSGSKTASIRIAREDSQITLDIQDEGRGMSSERLSEIQSGPCGVGVPGMRERLHQFGGEMKIESDSRGTRIFMTIPASKTTRSEGDRTAESLMTAI